MKIIQAHKIRLKPNNKQIDYLQRACGVSRFVYNWGLSEWKRQYELGGKPDAYKLKKQFNAIKRVDFPFVTEVTKCASDQAFLNLGKAFQGFFRNIKNGSKPGYPRFKRKGIRDMFYISNDHIRFDSKSVRIPKLGWVNMREVLRFDGKIMAATVSKVANKWFIAVQVECEIPIIDPPYHPIGVDAGIKSLAVTSDGAVFENPKALKGASKRLRMLSKSVSRKCKGSSNRKKAVIKLACQHYKVSCIRLDAIHKASSAITKGVSHIGIENLNVKGMLKNHKIAKALSDASMSELLRQIEYKAKRQSVVVNKADRFYPSSKKCSHCGNIKRDLTLADRTYKCNLCGVELDRDLNAAFNLRNVAVGSTVSACGLISSGFVLGQDETTKMKQELTSISNYA